MAGDLGVEIGRCSLLKDFSVDVEIAEDEEDRTFSLCFWVYLFGNTTFPATIIRQVHSDMSVSSPFLVLNESKKLMLLPLTLLHKEAPDPGNTASWTEVPSVSTNIEFPLEKWVHVGCEVSTNYIRLHIDGKVVGEQSLTSLLNENLDLGSPRDISLFSVGGDGYSVQGYIQNAEVLPSRISVKDHYVKDPPLRLSVDNSSTTEIELDKDGVWSIVGGKASCRRIFSLDVVLLNAPGQAVNKDIEVVASLIYADGGTPVEKSSDAEAPLLASCDGIEFAASDKPSKLVNGRASFKLKISQLSSKCDNRLFCIKFEIPAVNGCPFLEALSNPIRCISRGRNTKVPNVMSRRASSGSLPQKVALSFGSNNGVAEYHCNHSEEENPIPEIKRVKLGEDTISEMKQPDQECNSYMTTDRQFHDAFHSRSERRPLKDEEPETSSTDSESTEVREGLRVVSGCSNSVSDVTIFRYCLGSLTERSFLLKEIANTMSDEAISRFADEVSLFSGCFHHSYQIKTAKRLIVEGTKVWTLISPNNLPVLWESAIYEIEEQFLKIAKSARSLTQQDIELLRRTAGCQDYIAQENFEKLWCWLYPVAYAISSDWIHSLWNSTSPRWIEGFITKEEAEYSLRDPMGLHEPGTFVLRFPTSRSWPHPDAGSLVVTYVGRDSVIHHRLINHALCSNELQMNNKPLQDMLLAEPELSRLGRAIRSN